MINMKMTGLEYQIPAISALWLDKEYMAGGYNPSTLLAVVAKCAAELKDMRAMENRLEFVTVADRTRFDKRLADFQKAGTLAVEILGEILDRESEALKAARLQTRPMVRTKKGDYILPDFCEEWLSRKEIMKLDQESLIEVDVSLKHFAGELDLVLTNLNNGEDREVIESVRTLRNKFFNAIPLFQTEINRRDRVNAYTELSQMFAVVCEDAWLRSDMIEEMSKEELKAAIAEVATGREEANEHASNPQSWWKPEIAEIIKAQLCKLDAAQVHLSREITRRVEGDVFMDKIMAAARNGQLIQPIFTGPVSAQEKFFQALLDGKVYLEKWNDTSSRINVVDQ